MPFTKNEWSATTIMIASVPPRLCSRQSGAYQLHYAFQASSALYLLRYDHELTCQFNYEISYLQWEIPSPIILGILKGPFVCKVMCVI